MYRLKQEQDTEQTVCKRRQGLKYSCYIHYVYVIMPHTSMN